MLISYSGDADKLNIHDHKVLANIAEIANSCFLVFCTTQKTTSAFNTSDTETELQMVFDNHPSFTMPMGITYKTSGVRHSKTRSVPHCTVLPPGEYNGVIVCEKL